MIGPQEILTPEGSAKIHSMVTGDEVQLLDNELSFRLFLPDDRDQVELIGEYNEPGWYLRHRYDTGSKKIVYTMKVPDYRNDVAAALGLASVCMDTRNWAFSVSMARGTPIVVEVIFDRQKEPCRSAGLSVGDAILGGIWYALAKETNSEEEYERGMPWLH